MTQDKSALVDAEKICANYNYIHLVPHAGV